MIDEKVRLALLSIPNVTIGQVEGWQRKAFDEGRSLYSVAFADESINEPALVKALAGALSVTPVSLENFASKPKLLEIFPPEVCRRHLALAIGLKPNDGVMTVFVGLADPLNVDTLEELAKYTEHPIIPLLAGPADLQRAIARVLPKPKNTTLMTNKRGAVDRGDVPTPAQRIDAIAPPTVKPPGRLVARASTTGLFADIDEIAEPLGGDAASALTLLDDIPARRHEMQTSPDGYASVVDLAESDLPNLGSGSHSAIDISNHNRSGLSLERSSYDANAQSNSAFSSSGLSKSAPRNRRSSSSGLPSWGDDSGRPRDERPARWQDVDSDQLLNALVRLLLQRGLVTTSELEQIIADLAQS